jgi:hypothetical protein
MNELELNKVLDNIKEVFIDIMRSIDLDASNFVKSTTIKLVGNEIQIDMPQYGTYIDSGRRRGARQPPIDAIVQYIRDKGISIPRGSTEKSLAFAIARSISEKGIAPRPFIERLHEEIHQILVNYVDEQAQEVFLKMINKFD